MIIGKKVSATEKPFIFKMPFDNFFSMTDNLVPNIEEMKLVANGDVSKIPICENLKINTINLINYTRLGISVDFKSWIKNAV
jgi:hypothetical protein